MKHKFFDLDGTITPSRQLITKEMKEKLLSFNEPIRVVSGAERKRLLKQMDGVPCIVMAQNGNDTDDWQNKLTDSEINEIWRHLDSVAKFASCLINKDTVHNRGCQISFSFTGHDADVGLKKLFDPTKNYRRYILEKVPFNSKRLIVRVAGTTCFDYNRKGNLKGDNLRRYMQLYRLDPKDCIYYGDNFDEGGNDESVKGVMECVEVSSPEDLLKKL
jgi:HAD superfamily hydrolase (TIGR01484 family)